MEVKGVTLEENGVALFPDAPTQRGVKHLRELIRCQQEGYRACALFVVQMQGISYFTPNRRTHPEFAQALEEAAAQGVRLEAVDCRGDARHLDAGRAGGNPAGGVKKVGCHRAALFLCRI